MIHSSEWFCDVARVVSCQSLSVSSPYLFPTAICGNSRINRKARVARENQVFYLCDCQYHLKSLATTLATIATSDSRGLQTIIIELCRESQ